MKKLLLLLIIPLLFFTSCNSKKLYECSICKMKFKEYVWAKKCKVWCLENNSCNAEITKHSVK